MLCAAVPVAAGVAFLAAPSLAGIDPLSGVDFVTIGDPGNTPYDPNGSSEFSNDNMGGVNYSYNIGVYQIDTAQWVAFMNAAFDRPQSQWIPFINVPAVWGAVPTSPTVPGGMRWAVPAGNGMMAVGGISWRTAAIYCNWLCNGEGSAPSAFMNGAYDVSTFGYFGNIFTDQSTHNPGAKYWIPTQSEWLKAAYYDPNRYGPGQGGYWQYSNGSNSPYSYGLPGNGHTANSLYSYPGNAQFQVPLGSYPGTTSPWGLYDVAGEPAEWTEGIDTEVTGFRERVVLGTAWASPILGPDEISVAGASILPDQSSVYYSFRLAMAVPSPSTGFGAILAFSSWYSRRGRHDSRWGRKARWSYSTL